MKVVWLWVTIIWKPLNEAIKKAKAAVVPVR